MATFEELFGLAGETEARIKGHWPDSNVGGRLGWAAMNLGGAQAAVGMIESVGTQNGLADLRKALGVDSYDALEAAAVALASRSAVSAVDLCAAAAWLVLNRPKKREPAFNDFSRDQARKLELLPDHQNWIDDVAESDTWDLLSKCRNQAVHGKFTRTVKLSVGTPRIPHDDFEVGGDKYAADDLVKTLAESAVGWFRDFCGRSLAIAEFKVTRHGDDDYQWRLETDTGEIIARSAEGYESESDCRAGIGLVQRLVPTASTDDKTN